MAVAKLVDIRLQNRLHRFVLTGFDYGGCRAPAAL